MTTENTAKDKPVKVGTSITTNRAKKLANELTQFLEQNNLIYKIAGKNYVPVEGWQFVGSQLGLTDRVINCEPEIITDAKEIKYKAMVEIVNQNGFQISQAFAWCSNKEDKKKGFDEYAIASMAQTRAIGKAYRNILAWIVKMAGFESTPAEEINRENVEAELAQAKIDVLKTLNDFGIIKGNEIMDKIHSVLGKRVIETTDEARKVMESLEEENESA